MQLEAPWQPKTVNTPHHQLGFRSDPYKATSTIILQRCKIYTHENIHDFDLPDHQPATPNVTTQGRGGSEGHWSKLLSLGKVPRYVTMFLTHLILGTFRVSMSYWRFDWPVEMKKSNWERLFYGLQACHYAVKFVTSWWHEAYHALLLSWNSSNSNLPRNRKSCQ